MSLHTKFTSACARALILLSVGGLAALPGQAQTAQPGPKAARLVEVAATPQVIEQLRRGGFTLYLRHSLTDNTHPDRVPEVDLNDCDTQRPLTEQGKALAAQVGRAMAQAGVPVGEIDISPMCRVKDTAEAAFPGRSFELDPLLMYTGNLTSEQKAPILAHTRRLLSEPVAAGSNRLVIAHGPNLADLTGYFPKEATLVVFRPRGDKGFKYVASIRPEAWAGLLRKIGRR